MVNYILAFFLGVFFALLPQSSLAGCNAYGCSSSANAQCNAYGCPSGQYGMECNAYGCTASEIAQCNAYGCPTSRFGECNAYGCMAKAQNREDSTRSRLYFRGYPCTQDCSGHMAGYQWALKKRLSSPSQCSGRSNSFIEGCISRFNQGPGSSVQADVTSAKKCRCAGSDTPGGGCYSGPGGSCYDGPGGPLYDGPGGALYDGPGGACYDGPGGGCYDGPGGNIANCPTRCRKF